ncbi:hypothetical protein MVEN_00327300 [Mycena venus]|uniref:Uncharacterized protein n=1 Tax=Mycena venus TaxID=2733690 RepID=A0A8H6YQW8_9AGAR|nr:hypothetical protein MVEN_00327300 [Mycena venus]
MSLSTPFTILAVSLAIRPVHAFTNNNGNFHRSTTSRIIGAVIGVVVLLGILVFLCVMRRRRARAGGPIIGTGFAPGGTGTGKFGGGFNRWGNRNTQYGQNQNQAAYQPGYFPGGTTDGGKYPPPAGEPVPPPYTSANPNQQGGAFSAPSGPPPQQGAYNAPPGPPPEAHVHGNGQQNNNFVGGFRS